MDDLIVCNFLVIQILCQINVELVELLKLVLHGIARVMHLDG